jgi:hypothetical protein
MLTNIQIFCKYSCSGYIVGIPLSPYGCTSFRICVLYGWSCIKCMVRGVLSWMPMDFATYWLQQNQEDSLLSRSGLYRQTIPHQTLANKLRNCMEIWRLRSVFGACFLCEGYLQSQPAACKLFSSWYLQRFLASFLH